MIRIYIYIVLTTFISSCNSDYTTPNKGLKKDQPETIITEAYLDSLILKKSELVLQSVKEKNWANFIKFLHPTKGTRFTPYAHISIAEDIILFQNTFTSSLNDTQIWGLFDGSGEAISYNTKEYFENFVYDADFINSERTLINNYVGKGNSINNIEEVYPSKYFTEHYFSGFDPKYDGMDWVALRLVFEEFDGAYYLIGVIHDQWTI